MKQLVTVAATICHMLFCAVVSLATSLKIPTINCEVRSWGIPRVQGKTISDYSSPPGSSSSSSAIDPLANFRGKALESYFEPAEKLRFHSVLRASGRVKVSVSVSC